MRRLYFNEFFPHDLFDIMGHGCSVKHPRIVYANSILKKKYNAKIKKHSSSRSSPFYLEFKKDEDVVAFKLAHGY